MSKNYQKLLCELIKLMSIIFRILIFCIVLFFYIHIFFHVKTSNDLEVYEIEQPSKDKLEEICDLRQPVLFHFNNKLNNICSLNEITKTYGAFDIKIRNIKQDNDLDEEKKTELYIPITLNAAIKLFNSDEEEKYLSESNAEFLEETALQKKIKYNDEFIRPYMVSSCNYDILMASKGTCTPFRYELSYRNYYLVTQGEVTIKLAPPKSSKIFISY